MSMPPLLLLLIPTSTLELLSLLLGSAVVVKVFDMAHKAVSTWWDGRKANKSKQVHETAEARRIRLEEVDTVIDSLNSEVKRLNESIARCHEDHQKCNRSINHLTIANLRLNARVTQHELTINALQRQLNIPETDFTKDHRDETETESPDS